jgi:chorismate synthase
MALRFLTAGESHGPGLTAILEGIPAGLPLDAASIDNELGRRQSGYGAGPRMKIEQDRVILSSGVMEGRTIGAPIAMSIENRDHAKWRDKAISPFTIPRPGHVDLAGLLKYGYSDIRPALERASARETATRVAVGAICKLLLKEFNIRVGGYVCSIGSVTADLGGIDLEQRVARGEASAVRCPDEAAAELMQQEIHNIIQNKDTLGGVLEIIALGVPPGLGSHVHWDRRLEAKIGAAFLSVPAIKGVEIGPAFENTRLPGTRVHDAIRLAGRRIIRQTSRSGGIEGGISTGQALFVRAAMKPIATTLTPQQSVDLSTGEEVDTQYERSDFCPVPRAVPILEAMLAFVLADALLEKLGGDSLDEIKPRYERLRLNFLADAQIDSADHRWWG